MNKLGKIALVTGLGVAVLGTGLWLGWDAISKRNVYPERNVVYRAVQTRTLQGGEKEQNAEQIDRENYTQVHKGSQESGTSVVEDIYAQFEYQTSDFTERYHLKDAANIRIANGFRRHEGSQNWVSLKGLDELLVSSYILFGDNDSIPKGKLYTIKEIPERGLEQPEISVMIKNGKRVLGTRMVEKREWGMGWLGPVLTDAEGENWRAGTLLENYSVTSDDSTVQNLLKLIEEYNSGEAAKSAEDRRDLLAAIKQAEKQIPRNVVYVAYEDGIFDYWPQESTIFLGYQPSFGERAGFWAIDGLEQFKERLTLGILPKAVHKDMVLRVENKWDFTPPHIGWGIGNALRYSDGNKKVFSLFDKWNNGGYVILDNKGTLAEVRMKDFWLHYDKDLVYQYFLDLDGNGKIDRKKELIGEVLYRVTRNEVEDKSVIEKGQGKRTITFTYEYSFMAGVDRTPEGRERDFMLCGYIESLLPDQMNRGYGKHSQFGLINEVRASIMLFNNRTVENISRAMTEENTLVAPTDIYKLLRAAQRPYADEYAQRAGIDLETVLQAPVNAPKADTLTADTLKMPQAVLYGPSGNVIDTTAYLDSTQVDSTN